MAPHLLRYCVVCCAMATKIVVKFLHTVYMYDFNYENRKIYHLLLLLTKQKHSYSTAKNLSYPIHIIYNIYIYIHTYTYEFEIHMLTVHCSIDKLFSVVSKQQKKKICDKL